MAEMEEVAKELAAEKQAKHLERLAVKRAAAQAAKEAVKAHGSGILCFF